MNYKFGDKVLLRVRPKRRIIFDDPYQENSYLEGKPFTIIGIAASEPRYVVSVEDPTLSSWSVNNKHITDYGILTKHLDKPAYAVMTCAIGGIAPHLSYCKECQDYVRKLKLRAESGSMLEAVEGHLALED